MAEAGGAVEVSVQDSVGLGLSGGEAVTDARGECEGLELGLKAGEMVGDTVAV